MTEKQKLFADEYLKDLNGSRAYKTIYKNVKKDSAAEAGASRLLRNVKVKEYIDKRLEEIHNENTADIAEVMEYLTSVMRGNSKSEVLCLDDGSQKVVKKHPEEKDRLKAAELIGKRYGLFKDNALDLNIISKKETISNIDSLVQQMKNLNEDDINE